MALPSAIGYCKVTGTFTTAGINSTADGSENVSEPLAGLTVTFTTSLRPSSIVRNTTAGSERVIAIKPIICYTDASGRIIGSDSLVGVSIPASNDPNVSPTGWTYTVAVVGPDFPKVEFSMIAPTGGSVDLSQDVSVPPSPGEAVVAWQDAVSQALAAVAEAEAARDVAYTLSTSYVRLDQVGIGIDTDGVPYYSNGLAYQDARPILVDTDGVPYVTI